MGYGETVNAGAEVGLFAVPALFITFRETTEAAIIVSVLLGLLDKCGQPQLKRWVWLAVLVAAAVVVLLAIVLVVVLSFIMDAAVSQTASSIVGGVIALLAAVLIAFVALTLSGVMAIHEKYSSRLHGSLMATELSRQRLFWVTFVTILREGLETILFFVGVGAAFPPESLPIPAVVGALLGVLCGVLLYRCGSKLAISWFFKIMMVLLVFIGAGMFAYGVRELQEAEAFGAMEADENPPPLNVVLFSLSACCGLQNQFWLFMRVMFGYQPEPTGLELIAYFGYHLCVWTALWVKYTNQARKAQNRPTLGRELCLKAGCAKPGPGAGPTVGERAHDDAGTPVLDGPAAAAVKPQLGAEQQPGNQSDADTASLGSMPEPAAPADEPPVRTPSVIIMA
jgi:high-affinity iron transporter